MSLWSRVRSVFSREGTYEFGPSSANIDGWRRERSSGRTGDHPNWGASAWDVYRYTPEVRAAVDWRARAMSRVRLYPAWIPTDNGEPQPIEETAQTKVLIDPVRELFGGPLQQAEIMRRWYTYRLVAGECIIAGVQPTIEERQRLAILDDWLWMVRDATPVTGSSTSSTITLTWRTGRGAITRRFDLDDIPDDVIFKHDRVTDLANPDVADSPTRTVMDDSELLRNVADSINAMSVSRIASAGMLAVTADVTIPGFGGPGAPEDEDPVLAGMSDAMDARMENRRSASSFNPILFRSSLPASEAPIDAQITTIDTSTEYDERTLDILDWISRRVAITYNVPVEVTNGTADSNHWNALHEGQDGARIVIAPDAADFCRLVHEMWCQWRLVRRGVPLETVRAMTVWYDASALVQDPDRSSTLIALRTAAPELVTGQEVRAGVGLPSEPDEPDFAPPTTPSAPASSSTAAPRLNSGQAAVPSLGGSPVVRIPGYPTPPSAVVAANGRSRRA